MQSSRDDGVLILCKAMGLSRETLSAVMKVRFSSGGLTDARLESSKLHPTN
jgi:hypothetical protein